MKNIQLNKLAVSAKNVRKTGAENGLDELIASIKSHGLLENLIVVKTANDNYEVVGGGRRLRALQALVTEGHIKDTKSIPCEIVDIEKAEEISLAENQVRNEMHPADQFEAWAKLVDNGLSVADIAARFGTNEKLVKQRLKLGKVSPALMQAYREEKISLDILMAFTVTDDHAKQDEVLESVLQKHYVNAYTIKEELLGHAIGGSNKVAKFVGVKEYEEAGGYLKRDLFSDNENNVYFEDRHLLENLALSKLSEEARKVEGEWKWLDMRFDFNHVEKGEFEQLDTVFIKDVPELLTDGLKKLKEDLEGYDYWNEEAEKLREEQVKLEKELDDYKGYTEEQMSKSGFIVFINHQGEVEVEKGLLRPEDIEAKESSEELQEDSNPKKEKPLYSNALCDSLKNYRLHSVKMAVASDYEMSFDLALYSMCCTSFRDENRFCSISSLSVDCDNYTYPTKMRNEDETLIAQIEEQDKFYSKLPLDWMKIDDPQERFDYMCELSIEDKQKLFSACVSRTISPQLSNGIYPCSVFESVGKKLKVEVSKSWRPTEANLFGRLSKTALLKIGGELIGENWAVKNMSLKKKAIAQFLDDFFNSPSEKKFTAEQIEAIKKWLPEGMVF